MIDYKFCPCCRNELKLVGREAGNPHIHCERCGFRKWNNPLPTTIGLIIEGRNVLLVERAHAPRRGVWDTVGGFLVPQESAEECLAREAAEELGLAVRVRGYVGTFPSVYGETGMPTIGLAFYCELPPGGEILLTEENSAYAWFPLDRLPEVAFDDVASALREAAARLP